MNDQPKNKQSNRKHELKKIHAADVPAPASQASQSVIRWIALAIFIFAFIPRTIYPYATSICYDEGVAKGDGSIVTLWKNGDFDPAKWKDFTVLMPAQYIYGVLPQMLFGSNPNDPMDLAGARFMGALFSSGIITLIFLIGTLFLPLRTAILGSMLLAFIPTVLGHDRIAMHDTPSRFFVFLAWWLILRWSANRSNRLLITSAACSGLAFALYHRTGAQSGIAMALWMCLFLFKEKIQFSQVLKTLSAFAGGALASFLAIVFIMWPYLWSNPAALPGWYIGHAAMANTGGCIEFWFGKWINVPPYYYFVALAVCTPPLTLIAFLVWHIRSFRSFSYDRYLSALLFLFWVSLLTASYSLRMFLVHYMQILYPVISLGAAASIWSLYDHLVKRQNCARMLLFIPAFVVIMELTACLNVSPFFIEYFNIFSGGGRRIEENNTFSVPTYGEGLKPMFAYLKTNAVPGSTVMCHLGPWPGLFRLQDYLGPEFPQQGYKKVDPLGARYILVVSLARTGAFYRYEPDTRYYQKSLDVLADDLSLGRVWERKDSKDLNGLCYADDFSSPQFSHFAMNGSNFNINVFSGGKLYSIRPNTPSFLVMKFPANIAGNYSFLRFEADVQMLNGEFHLLVGNNISALTDVVRASGTKGRFASTDYPCVKGQDLFVVFKWYSRYEWDGKPETFYDDDWIDAFRIFGK